VLRALWLLLLLLLLLLPAAAPPAGDYHRPWLFVASLYCFPYGLCCCCLLQHPPLETITCPGEVLYVPRGWWHMVLNLDHAVAVTQNYVSSVGLPAVLAFLKQGSQQLVSGCCLQDRCGTTLHLQCSQGLLQCLPVMQISCVCHVMMCTA
jgi:hypothetical protein